MGYISTQITVSDKNYDEVVEKAFEKLNKFQSDWWEFYDKREWFDYVEERYCVTLFFMKYEGRRNMCDHKWVHFETRYLYIDNYPGSSQFKRIDRFFCEKCCEEKVIEKSSYDYYEDRHPEWFNWNNYERVQK